MRGTHAVLMLLILTVLATNEPALAQNAAPPAMIQKADGDTSAEQGAPASGPRSLFQIVFSGGPFGLAIVVVLFAMSIVALALTIDSALAMRAPVFMPRGLADEVRQQLAAGNIAAASEACQMRPSLLAVVLYGGLKEFEFGWYGVTMRMEETLAAQAARLSRKLDYLALVAQLAPLVGLVGTIGGVIVIFRAASAAPGVEASAQMASGVYQALVSTLLGLLIAIPAWAATVILRNRAEQLTADTAELAGQAVSPFKNARLDRGDAPPPVGGSR